MSFQHKSQVSSGDAAGPQPRGVTDPDVQGVRWLEGRHVVPSKLCGCRSGAVPRSGPRRDPPLEGALKRVEDAAFTGSLDREGVTPQFSYIMF